MKVIDVKGRDFSPEQIASIVEQSPVRVILDDGRSFVAVPESSWEGSISDSTDEISQLRRELASITPGSACRI